MRHRKKTVILSRSAAARKALLRGLLTSLMLHGKIRTTQAKARIVRSAAERLVTVAKRKDLAGRRHVTSILHTEQAVTMLLDTIAPKYKERSGGYTRVLKVGPRQGDGARMVQIEFV